jgi:hypothetical protein
MCVSSTRLPRGNVCLQTSCIERCVQAANIKEVGCLGTCMERISLSSALALSLDAAPKSSSRRHRASAAASSPLFCSHRQRSRVNALVSGWSPMPAWALKRIIGDRIVLVWAISSSHLRQHCIAARNPLLVLHAMELLLPYWPNP